MNLRAPILEIAATLTGSRILKNLDQIKQLDNRSKEDLKTYQENKLNKLLVHAWKNVPYWQDVLEKSSVVSNGKVDLNSFSKIPILTKEILRKDFERLLSCDRETRGWY